MLLRMYCILHKRCRVQIVLQSLNDAKELVSSVMEIRAVRDARVSSDES
jgi:hypothetical protein